MSLTVLVTDGDQRAALATVRALGRVGHRVYVCGTHLHSIASASRYCTGAAGVADPLHKQEDFLSGLLQIEKQTGADLLIPVSEASLLAVLPHRDRFSSVIPFASAESFERICDKRSVLQSAQLHGLSVPLQGELSSPEDARLLNGAVQYPLVLKPHRSVAGKKGERIRASVRYASNAREMDEVLSAIPPSAYPVLAQERIDGPGFGISVLLWNGTLKAAFAHRRIREKPPSGGVSVLRESIPLDAELLDRSVAVLREFGWQGVAMVEFKLDARTGVPYLMEINGRLWGSLQLAIDAGVDFPNLLLNAALGIESPPVLDYRNGIRSRWEWGDVDHLLASMIHSSRTLALSTKDVNRNRLGKLREFFRAFGPDNLPEVFRRDDPGPFFRETANWFRGR